MTRPTEGMTRKGGRNQGPSQIKKRPDAPAAIGHVAPNKRAPRDTPSGGTSVSLNQRCVQCGHVEYGFSQREPEAGYYWLLRSDGRVVMGEVIDNEGRKSVRFAFSSNSPLGLNYVRREFKFVQRVTPPAEYTWCPFHRWYHVGGDTCMGAHP